MGRSLAIIVAVGLQCATSKRGVINQVVLPKTQIILIKVISTQKRYLFIAQQRWSAQLEIIIQPVEFLEVLNLPCASISRIILIEKGGGASIFQNIEIADGRIDVPVGVSAPRSCKPRFSVSRLSWLPPKPRLYDIEPGSIQGSITRNCTGGNRVACGAAPPEWLPSSFT